MSLPKLTLILGGAASGKSVFAESLVLKEKLEPVYIATAQVFDNEMAEKVARHRAQRGDRWITIEEPLAVAEALKQSSGTQAVLIDCVTLWLTNILLDDRDIAAESNSLMKALAGCAAPIVIVSNEVGYGIVPENALSRRFRNAQGRLNQDIAAQADCVVSVMAGLPMVLKGALP